MRTIYIIGKPGSGKSTALSNALAKVNAEIISNVKQPIPHIRYKLRQKQTTIWEIGAQRQSFSGTDALGMNIQPKAVQWVTALREEGTVQPDLLIGEGDRLATKGFIDSCPKLTLVVLEVPDELALLRGRQRAERLGVDPQNQTWFKGRASKIRNLKDRYPHLAIDGLLSKDKVSDHLAAIISEQIDEGNNVTTDKTYD